jgi:putative membrane protein
MKNTFALALAASCFTLSACATVPTDMAAMGDLTPEQAQPYTQMAAASDLFEIESSRLALSRSQNADIRQFAQMMVDHHSQTTQQLMAAAGATGITVAPALMPAQSQMLQQLQQAGGSGFDSLYRTQQVQAHEMALALHGNYAGSGDAPALRQVATAAVPIVTQHLARIRSM